MRIGIDATSLWGLREGSTGGMINYTVQIASHLVANDRENEYVIYFRNGIFEEHADLTSRATHVVLSSSNRKILQQIGLPKAAQRDGLDLLFFPFNSASLRCHCPSVVTVHDLHPFVVPELFAVTHGTKIYGNALRSRVNRLYWQNVLRFSSRRATRIIAVSSVTKRDIETLFRMPSDKIDVVHEGVDLSRFAPTTPAGDTNSFRERYGIPQRYVLCVGAGAYKNLEGSVCAFDIVRRRVRDLKLVVTGPRKVVTGNVRALIEDRKLRNDIVFTDFVSDNDIEQFYRHAELLLYPSHYEGFGLPLLEAFACGTPVVSSTAGAIPEVAGEAAILVDPMKPDAIADAVVAMITDASLRETKRALGFERVAQFTWQEAARKTANVFRKAVDG